MPVRSKKLLYACFEQVTHNSTQPCSEVTSTIADIEDGEDVLTVKRGEEYGRKNDVSEAIRMKYAPSRDN
jgi:hypothetical protein